MAHYSLGAPVSSAGAGPGEPFGSDKPLETVALHLGNAESLADRVINLVERLTGPVAQAAGSATDKVARGGRLYDIEAVAGRVGVRIDEAHNALSRVEALI